MNHFAMRAGQLHAEGVPLARIAREVGTPTYVYAQATLERHFRAMDEALAPRERLVCYSVKASSNLALLKLFAGLGAGFDIVSGGELHRVMQAGGDARRVVFSGVGKTDEELDLALDAGVLLFNVESAEELARLAGRAKRKKKVAPVALRVNPAVDPKTHPYIATGLKSSKFGIAMAEAKRLYVEWNRKPGVSLLGVDCHIGSQLTELAPLADALSRVTRLFRDLRKQGVPLRYLDVGGGLGITYEDEAPPEPAAYAQVVSRAVAGIDDLTLLLEPGRVLVGNAAVLLTTVLYRKQAGAKRFVIVDAGMNDLIRPALYGAHHRIEAVKPRAGKVTRVEVVGPVCESSDVLGSKRDLPPLEQGDLLAIRSAGAYGMSMASTYNSRRRPAEVLVSGRGYRVVRERDTWASLTAGEHP